MFEMPNDVSTMFMDLSKVFGTLNHNSLITKFGAYGFERDSVVYENLLASQARTGLQVNNYFSSREKSTNGSSVLTLDQFTLF